MRAGDGSDIAPTSQSIRRRFAVFHGEAVRRVLLFLALFGCGAPEDLRPIEPERPPIAPVSRAGEADTAPVDLAAWAPKSREREDPPPPDPEDPEDPPSAPAPEELLRRFAPVWYHDTATGGPDGEGARADYYMPFDFDGDLRHDNNWDHLPGAALEATIYYAFLATDTHYYFTFSQYHARDWAPICTGLFTECHEGDMESVHLAILRGGEDGGDDTLIAVVTSAHGRDLVWADDPSRFANGVSGPLDYESDRGEWSATFDATHSHVRIYTQAQGHGPIPCRAREHEPRGGFFGFLPRTIGCPGSPENRGFHGGDGIVFRYRDGAATPYRAGMDGDPSIAHDYQLLDYETHLWPHRFEIGSGRLFTGDPDELVLYTGARGDPAFHIAEPLGTRFDSEQFLVDNSGVAAWSTELEGSNRGDLFFDPAFAFSARLGIEPPLSGAYSVHPYLFPTP